MWEETENLPVQGQSLALGKQTNKQTPQPKQKKAISACFYPDFLVWDLEEVRQEYAGILGQH